MPLRLAGLGVVNAIGNMLLVRALGGHVYVVVLIVVAFAFTITIPVIVPVLV